MGLLQSILDVCQCIGLRMRRQDASIGQELCRSQQSSKEKSPVPQSNLVRWYLLEDIDGSIEVVYYFLLWQIVFVAAFLECADTGAVLVPLVLPQIRVVAPEIFPVFTHILEQISMARIDEDQRNITVLSAGVAVLIKSTITVIRPVAC